MSAKSVADYENISVSNAYNLNVIYYLNILAYLKDFNKYQSLQHKKWEQQIKMR
jgi:hypothetical protein